MPSMIFTDEPISSYRSIARDFDDSQKHMLEQITFNLNKNGQIWVPLTKVVLRDQAYVLPKLGNK
jgi:hypothetical protein